MDIDMDPPPLPPPLPPASPGLTRTGRPRRNYRLPRRFQDFLPESAAIFDSPPQTHSKIQRVLLVVKDRLVTAANSFGIWRDYPRRPTRDPDSSLRLSDLAEHPPKQDKTALPPHPTSITLENLPSSSMQPYWPFTNSTIHGIMQWLNNGNTAKSESQMNEFVNNVILSPEFSQDHVLGFDAHRENLRLDKALANSSLHAQFQESTVDILVPSGAVGVPSQTFTVPGLLHRKLTTVIIEAFNSSLSHLYHFSPFKLYHPSPITKKKERIFSEIYNSDVFIAEHEEVQRHALLPPEDSKCKREKVIAALMFSSDATHLTTFGNAKVWPIYLMLGNLSKYIRAQPSSRALHHLAYIPSVSHFQKTSFSSLNLLVKAARFISRFASNFHCRWRSQKHHILTHCRRELMQNVWSIILDDDFLYACTYGIVIKCIDGAERRVYPRIFTYSADYPEK